MSQEEGTTSGVGVRRLIGAPPSKAAMRNANGNKRAKLVPGISGDTEEGSGDETDDKTAEDPDPDEETKPTEVDEDQTTVKRRKRKKRRIRLTDQGLKQKRKAERREKLLAEKKLTEGEEEPVESPTPASPGVPEKQREETPQEKPSPRQFTPFQLFCDCILRKLEAKDPDGYFAEPVTESEAPDYHGIIDCPMDFSTIRSKIEQNSYEHFDEFRSDVTLISSNAILYNCPNTVYHIAAQKLSLLSTYYLSEKFMVYLVYSLPFGKAVPLEKLEITLQQQARPKQRQVQKREEERQRALSFIRDDVRAEEITKSAPSELKKRLTSRKPNHIGYLDNRGGAIALNLLTATSEDPTKQLTLGDYVRPLSKGNPGVCCAFEPNIAQDYFTTYSNPGPYASFAPYYDTTWATLSKRDSDLLLSCYGDKDNVADVTALKQMVENAGSFANKYVDEMLDELTDNEHSNTIARLESGEESAAADNNAQNNQSSSAEETADPIEERMQKTGKMIEELATLQYRRLSKTVPTAISDLPQPEASEVQLAGDIVRGLGQQIVELGVRPTDLVSQPALHQALGLNADEFDILSEFLEV